MELTKAQVVAVAVFLRLVETHQAAQVAQVAQA
jgi:hypothetical protein